MNKTNNELNGPYGHQKFLAGHLAKRELVKNGKKENYGGSMIMTVSRLETPKGKPVVIHGQEFPEHGTRIDVSRGSFDTGNLVLDQTVSIEPLPGGYLPELHKPTTPNEAQELIDDLRSAK